MLPSSAEIHLQLLTQSDLNFGERLCAEAGWNQTASDWIRVIQQEPEGCFLARWNGAPAGTVSTTCYQRQLAWLGMMLVDPDFQRRGIATALMQQSLHYLDGLLVPCVKLDATPSGRPVYERLGFEPECEFHRWRREGSAGCCRVVPDGSDTNWPWALDQQAFGANRREWLLRLAADSHVVTVPDGAGMLRTGRSAAYLGPVVAKNTQSAAHVIDKLLTVTQAPLLWDIPSVNSEAESMAREREFEPVRLLTRMRRGSQLVTPQQHLQYAAADLATG